MVGCRPALFASLLLLPLAACSCDGDGLSNVGQDSGVKECPGGEQRPMGRCMADTDCCPRESCFIATGICFALDKCGPDNPCPEPNQLCEDSNNDGFTECVFERCDENIPDVCADKITCPPDKIAACVAGGCICGEPCQGGCPSHQGCCVPDNMCEDLPERCLGLTCPPGQFVSRTSTGAWSTGECRISGEVCECRKLPPLPLGDIGLYSAIAHDGTNAVISAYNLDYGDLMFGIVGADASIDWEFVDGVPTSTDAITGDIDGPRGGNSAPGDDTGIYTDIAVDARARAHITYQDRDRGALRYAIGGGGAPWTMHTIEGDGPGDTGLYSSLVLDPGGRPRVAYLSVREPSGPGSGRRSVLRLAFASTDNPTGSSSWELRDLETVDLRTFDCEDRCNPEEVCRAADLACVTPDPAPTLCGPNCGPNERCIGGTCTLTEPLPPFRDLPRARGLWPSMQQMPDGGVMIAYHDRIDQTLKIARIAGPDLRGGALTIAAIDGNGVNGSNEEAGLFPSLFVTPAGEIHVTYMNATRQSLVYRNLDPMLATLAVEEIEAGLMAGGGPDGSLIGADSALVVDRLGVVRVSYQDATHGDLRYARRDPGGTWTSFTLAGDEAMYRGSFGFYTDQTLGPNREAPVVSTYRYFLSAEMGPKNGVEVFSPP